MNKKIKDILDKINFSDMLNQVDQGALAASISNIESQLHLVKAVGEAGGGFVKAEVNGSRKVCSVSIDESLLDTKNKSILEDLIVAAINIANRKVDSLIEEKAMDGEWDHLISK